MSMECMGHLFCSFFGKISVYPHTILHKSRSHRGNLRAIVTPLPSFIQYCKHNELWGCAEISPDLTSSKLRFDGDVSFFFGTRDSDLIRTSFAASAIKHGVSISRKYCDVCYCCTSSVEARGIPRWRVTEGKFWCKAEDERKYSWVPLEWQIRQIVFSISV